MRVLLLLLLLAVPFHSVALSPLEEELGVSINLRYVFGILWNYEACLLNNMYSEKLLDSFPRRADYDKVSLPSREITSFMRVNTEGPISMQGIFWLNLPGNRIMEVISFAPTEENLTTGSLSGPGPAYRLRQLGDRIWASTGFARFQVDIPDNIVELWLVEGTMEDPKKFQLIVDDKFPGTCIRYRTNSCPSVQANMTLQNTPYDEDDEHPSHDMYPSSVVWSRETTGYIEFDYEAIQIVDAEGNHLQPAYDDFIQAIDDLGGFVDASALKPNPRPTWCTRNNG